MKIAPILAFQNQLKIFHWQTFSYAEHKALGNSYEKLDELFDSLIEVYLGKYGKTYSKIEYNIIAESYEEGTNVKSIINRKKRELITYLRSEVSSDSDLNNIVDEIEAEINQLQYLLDLK